MVDVQSYSSNDVVPPPEVIEAMESGLVEVVRRVELYESDAETRWNPSAPDDETVRLLDGAVTVDYHSDERRKLDLKLENIDMKLRPDPNGGLWYDKVIKVFRGVRYASADVSTPLAIIEAPTDADARKISQTLSGLGFDDNTISLAEEDAGSLSAYSWIMSSLVDTATSKADLLGTLFAQGKNVITIGTGSSMTELPHYASESTTTSEPHVLYNEFKDPLFETLTYVYVYNGSTEALVAVAGEGNVVRVDPPAGNGLRAMLYPTTWGPNELIATRVRLRRNPDALMPAVVTNVVRNSSFEVDTSLWGGVRRTLTISSAWSNSGNNSARVDITDNSAIAYSYPIGEVGSRFPVTEGQTVRYTQPVRSSDSGDRGWRPSVAWYDDSNTGVGSSAGAWVAVPAGQEAVLFHEAEAPPGATRFLPITYHGTTTGAAPTSLWEHGHMDSIICTVDEVLPEYFDGDTPDDDTHTYNWTSTPHASSSIKSLIPKMTFTLIPYNGGSGAGGAIDTLSSVPITKDWLEFDLSGVTPDVVMDRVGLQCSVSNTPEGFEFDLAEATFVKLDSVPEQFSGDKADANNYTYDWEGAVNDSRSIRTTSVVTWGIDPITGDSPTAGVFVSEAATPRATGTRPLTLAAGAQTLAVWSDDPSAQIITAAFAYGPNDNLWLDIHLPNVDGVEAKKLLRAALYHMKNRVPYKIWEAQLGEYYIDGINTAHFPDEVSITARDGTKKLLISKLSRNSIFEVGTSLKDLIVGQAALAGIPVNKMHFNIDGGETLTSEMAFERGTSRWEIIKSALESFNYERFFDGRGNFVVRKYLDPSTSPVTWEFGTGPTGNLVSFDKSVNDSRIYNHVIVTADPSDQATDPIGYFGEALNNDPSSPTRIERLGDRVLPIDAPWLSSDEDCVALAMERLKVTSLESYELNFSSIYYPWLECGEIITILDPDALDFEPSRFLMDTIAYPLTLGPMSATGKRVTFVGSSGGTGV